MLPGERLGSVVQVQPEQQSAVNETDQMREVMTWTFSYIFSKYSSVSTAVNPNSSLNRSTL